MKRVLLIILSFIFLGGAVTGSALLLSGCNYEQTESGEGNSQDDILDDNQNNNEEDNSDEENSDNPDYDDDVAAQAHSFTIRAQFRTSSTSTSTATSSTSSPPKAFRLRWYDSNGTVSWGGTRTVNTGASDTSGNGYIYASYFSYSYSLIAQGRYVQIYPYSYSGYTCVGMTTSSSWSNTSNTTSNSSTRYYNGSLYSSAPATDESVTGTVYVRFRQSYNVGYIVWSSTNSYFQTPSVYQTMLAGVGPTLYVEDDFNQFTGYTLIGWSTTKNDTTPDYDPGEALPASFANGNKTLYAVYERDPYILTINYYSRSATNSVSLNVSTSRGTLSSSTMSLNGSVTLTADGTSTHTVTISESSSYTYYIGTSSSATTTSYSYSWSPTSNRTISIYVVQRYSITYNGNGATSGSTSKTYKRHGTNATIASNGFSRTGHTFQGWATSSSGSVRYDPGDSYTTNANELLYAVWEANTLTNTYYYRNKGGTNTSTTQTFSYGESFTTLTASNISNEYFSNGWVLVGWATSSTATSYISTGESILNYSGSSYYAVSRRQVSITYNTGGGSSVSSTTGYQIWNQYGNTYNHPTLTISSTTPTRSGYTFEGWSTSSSATTVNYDPGDSYTFSRTYTQSASVTLYAVWERISYTITYNSNGGSGTMSPTTKYYGESVTLRANTFTRTGYRFSGWATSSTGSVVYDDQDTYTANASDTLYAVWTRITYTITYNSNGGSGTMSSTTKYYGTSVTLRANTFTRTGYHFVGWALSSTGSVVYDNQDTYSTNASDTLYAKWSANTYYVNFNSNGGSGSMTRQTFTYGTYQSIKSNTFTRTGYTFTGWNRNSAGTSTSYSNGQSVRNLTTTNGGTVTLYAQWRVNVEAKYDSAGGYWYVENGAIPQTRVTNTTIINALNSTSTTGASYYIAGQTLQSRVYSGTEYCQWNGNWYEVEPIKWRLTSNSSQTDGYATTTDTDAVLAEIVYVGPYSTSSLDAGEGYSSEPASMMTQYNGVSTSYLVQVTKSVEIFGDGSTFHNTTNSSHYVFTASESEINSVSGTTAIEFSDLAEDIIKYYGGTNVYFTRDLGSNYNNIVCFNGVGKETQRFATDYRGVQFVIRFTEYVCVA
mgnify:CR=1 FL=1